MVDGDLVTVPDALSRIEALVAGGEDRYRRELSTLPSLRRLWIHVGDPVSRHCGVHDIGEGQESWSEVSRLRDHLAHHLLDEIDGTRLWVETIGWISSRTAALRVTR